MPVTEDGQKNINMSKDKNDKSVKTDQTSATGTGQTNESSELKQVPSATGEHSGQKSGTVQTSEPEGGQKAKNGNGENQVTDVTPQGSDSGSQVADNVSKNAVGNQETPVSGQQSTPVTTDIPAGQK